jgi:hypothetical protein
MENLLRWIEKGIISLNSDSQSIDGGGEDKKNYFFRLFEKADLSAFFRTFILYSLYFAVSFVSYLKTI